jgi:hypothetical protein
MPGALPLAVGSDFVGQNLLGLTIRRSKPSLFRLFGTDDFRPPRTSGTQGWVWVEMGIGFTRR